jgi:hypothetical protein
MSRIPELVRACGLKKPSDAYNGRSYWEYYRAEGNVMNGWKWDNIHLAKPKPYRGQNVWGGDWYAAPLFPGPRCLAILRDELPSLIDAKREQWPTSGAFGMKLWEAYVRGKTYVLDGVLGCRDKEGRLDFYRITPGMHVPPDTVMYADDVLTYDVFKAGAGTRTWLQRRKRLREIADEVPDDRVVPTKYKRIESRKELRKLERQCLALMGCGMIIRRDAPYRSGKSDDILKIGPLEEE